MPKRAPGVAGPATPPTPPEDRATWYAQQVAAGLLPAGPQVRDACARHLRDLVDGPARGLRWDIEAANRAIGFFERVLKLNGGEFEGKPFILLDWQAFIVGSLFGWMGANGYRRFRMGFVLTGKGSGKSPLAAGIGHYCFVADNEPRAEIYAAATMRDQAMVLFRDAVAMGRLSPELAKRFDFSGGAGKEWNIAYVARGSFFRVIASGDGQSGPRPHCALLDEIHEHHDNTMVEMLRAGTKGRRQALIFGITNAEANRTGICAQLRDYAAKVCRGDLVDDAFFAYVAALDPGDDPFKDESCWPKANPSLGHTFQLNYLREQVTQARGMPSKEAIVRRLHFCEPTDAGAPWIDRDLWERAEGVEWPADLAGVPCWAGLDLSSKRDLTALAVVWRFPDGKLLARVWFWTPGDTLEERARIDNVPYGLWREQEHLFGPPGRIVDKGHVALWLKRFAEVNNLQALAFDNHTVEDFERECEDLGFDTWVDERKPNPDGVILAPPGQGLRMIRHGQGFAGGGSDHVMWMPRSIGNLEDAVIQGNIAIRPNPCLRWNSASAVLLADPQANRKWDKKKSTGRIDGMVALSMAVGAAMAATPPVRPPIGDAMFII